MKQRRTGTMVSFTLGFMLGIYTTSEEGKNWIKEVAIKLFGSMKSKRNIIDLQDDKIY